MKLSSHLATDDVGPGVHDLVDRSHPNSVQVCQVILPRSVGPNLVQEDHQLKRNVSHYRQLFVFGVEVVLSSVQAVSTIYDAHLSRRNVLNVKLFWCISVQS